MPIFYFKISFNQMIVSPLQSTCGNSLERFSCKHHLSNSRAFIYELEFFLFEFGLINSLNTSIERKEKLFSSIFHSELFVWKQIVRLWCELDDNWDIKIVPLHMEALKLTFLPLTQLDDTSVPSKRQIVHKNVNSWHLANSSRMCEICWPFNDTPFYSLMPNMQRSLWRKNKNTCWCERKKTQRCRWVETKFFLCGTTMTE